MNISKTKLVGEDGSEETKYSFDMSEGEQTTLTVIMFMAVILVMCLN